MSLSPFATTPLIQTSTRTRRQTGSPPLTPVRASATHYVVELMERRLFFAGDGLWATYWDNASSNYGSSANFSGPSVTRVDPTVSFDWGTGSPSSAIRPDTFSVRWTGQIAISTTGTYTFYARTDDGVKLWVNGSLLINNWRNQPATERSGSIRLTGGQRYDIRIEYYENTGDAVSQLRWSGPSIAKTIIPQSVLYSGTSPAPTVPAAPSSLTATAASQTQVNLTWTDNSNNETGFKVGRSTDGTNFSDLATVGAGVTTYTDSAATAGTTYTYRVSAVNSAGSSDPSNPATATTPPLITIPSAPSDLTASATSPTQVNLAWADNSNNETGFAIERSTDGTTFTALATVGAGTTTYTDSTAAPATTYTYRVSASNSAGSSTASNLATATTPSTTITVPAAPSNLAATAASATQVNLTWTDNSSDETRFTIERSTDGTTFNSLATVDAGVTAYSDSTAAAATQYTYRVAAVNSAGSSDPSNLATATTPPAITTPAAPSNLTASATSPTQISLSWTDNSTNETGFAIERSTDGTSFSALATVAADVTTYTDSTAAAATNYTYRVTASNSAGSSAPSNPATATTPTPSDTATFVVSTTGSDSNSGSATSPFRTIAKALSVAQPGNTVFIQNGTYHESLSLTGSGASGKSITLMGESTSGVIVDGSGFSSVIVANGAQYITIENLTVRYAANGPQNYQAAVHTGGNWTLQDMVVEKVDGTGICANGSNVTIQRVTAQDNGVAGIGSDHADGLVVKDCITRRNNNGMVNPSWKNQTTISGYPAATKVNGLWYMNPDFEAGGGKYWQSNNVTIDNLQASDNVGPGIWFDYRSTNVTIRNSRSFNNRGIDSSHSYQGNGIRIELQDQGPFLVQNNLIYGNSGQAIDIESSRNITITGDTLVGGAVLFRDANRGAQYTDYNIKITSNQIKNGYFETWEGTWNSSSGAKKAIVIDANTYDNSGGKLFVWGGTSYNSLATVRSTLGFEQNGTLGAVTAPS